MYCKAEIIIILLWLSLIKYLAYLEESSHLFTASGLRKFCVYPSFDQNYCTADPSGVLTDIKALENAQRRATKFILNSYDSNYRLRLLDLQLLPLMMVLDILFFIKFLKEPCDHFDISRFVTFCSGKTRSASCDVLVATNNSTRKFYFNRLWNSLPPIDMSQSMTTIKKKLYKHFWNHFTTNFDPDNVCSFHYLCPCAKCSSLPVSLNFYSSLL